MCEIQLVKTFKGKIEKKDFEGFSEMLEQGSYSNPDAWGIYNDEEVLKVTGAYYDYEGKEDLFKLYAKNKTFIVGHNRLATQGDKNNNNNNHPFETEDFFLVHNGVISNDHTLKKMKELFYVGETDSIVILELIQALTNKGYSIKDTIKRTGELLEGSFSVLLYHKKDKKLYYFKNSKTSFSFTLITRGDKKLLFGSTDEQNFSLLYPKSEMIFNYGDYDSIITQEADAGTIYEINDKEIKVIGSFKEKQQAEYCYPKTFTKTESNYYSHKAWDDTKEDLYTNAKEVQEILLKEGFNTSLRLDYVDNAVYFKPTRVLSDREEMSVYSILGNNVFWDNSEGAFVMSDDDMETFLFYNYGRSVKNW